MIKQIAKQIAKQIVVDWPHIDEYSLICQRILNEY